MIWDVSRDDTQLESLLQAAHDALGTDDSALRVRVLGRLAAGPLRNAFPPANLERRRALSSQARDRADDSVSRRPSRTPSSPTSALHHSPDFTPEQAVLANELVEVALRAGDLELAFEGYEAHLTAAIELGDLVAARADLEAMAELADDLRQPAQRWLLDGHRPCRRCSREGSSRRSG